jgi:hypothetical protein
MDKILAGFAMFIGVIGLIIGLALLLAFPTMWIVNYLFAPSALMAVFGVAKFGLIRALIFNIFTGLVFKSYSNK